MDILFRLINLIKVKFLIPEKKNTRRQLRVDTCCDHCKWEGNFMQTTLLDDSNDACPVCGNTELTYIL